jgi:phage baseplate assembly protein W
MTEPVTGLTAKWLQGESITFSWTAAEDVTSQSIYEIYYLDSSTIVPSWVLWRTIKPIPVKSSTSSVHELMPPATSYLVPWADIVVLVKAGKIPALKNDDSSYTPSCLSFQIQHVDSAGGESDPATVFVLPPANDPTGAPTHLKNVFEFDSFGQLVTNLQDSFFEVEDSVSMCLGTLIGQRNMVPRFGIEDLTFKYINPQMLYSTVKMWEPRAIANFAINYDSQGNAVLNVDLQADTGV